VVADTGAGGGEVQDESHSGCFGGGGDAVDGRDGQFALRQHERRGGDAVALGVDDRSSEREVRATGDDDRVLARVGDGDLCDAGGGIRLPCDRGGGQAEPLERRDGEVAARVGTDAGDELDGCPGNVRGDRLIGALAAERDLEAVRQDRLAGRRERLDVARRVDVERAEDDDPTWCGHATPRVRDRRCCP